MSSIRFVVVILLLLSLIVMPSMAQNDFRDRIEEVAPAVVRISTIMSDGDPGAFGTGFVIWKTGEVFTNEHVIRDPEIETIVIETFVDFTEPPQPAYHAEIVSIASDPDTFDFAVLQITTDLEGRPISPEDLELTYIRRWNDDPDLGLTSQLIVLAYPEIGGDNLVISQGTLTSIMNREESAEMTADVAFGEGASGGMIIDGDFRLLGIATEQQSEGIGQSVVGFISMQSICDNGVIDCWETNPKRRETLETDTCQLELAQEYCEETIFGIGDMAQVGGLDTINPLRENPFSEAGITLNVPRGAFVEIVDGPQLSNEDPSFRISELFWWKVRTNDGIEGWLPENFFGEPTMVFARLEDPVIPTASCELVALFPLTIRGGPDRSFEQVASRRVDAALAADAQAEGSDGWTWWRLIPGYWVREDTVRENGTCFSLPIDENPPEPQ